MEVNNLPDKQFKVIIIKMLTNLRRKMEEHSKKLNKDKIWQSTKEKLQMNWKTHWRGLAADWMK